MRFIVMHKVDASMEAGTPPDQEIIQKMGEHCGAAMKNGIMEDGAGLHRSASRRRLETKGGKRTVTHGPLTGRNELVENVLMIRTANMESAIEEAARVAEVFGDVEIEVGPVVEGWDLGFMPKPTGNPPGRYLLLQKAKADAPLSARTVESLAQLKAKMTAEGVLLSSEQLAPSARGSRLAAGAKGKRTWTDGPFAESKELIAGFSVMKFPTKVGAIEWATTYANILQGNEVDVRELV